jgi:hypothetical protein
MPLSLVSDGESDEAGWQVCDFGLHPGIELVRFQNNEYKGHLVDPKAPAEGGCFERWRFYCRAVGAVLGSLNGTSEWHAARYRHGYTHRRLASGFGSRIWGKGSGGQEVFSIFPKMPRAVAVRPYFGLVSLP